MHRRRFLGSVGAAGLAGVAGCIDLFASPSDDRSEPPLVEDRPAAVYVPTHVESMQMVGMASAGRLRLALSYSFPHRFWTMEAGGTNTVEIQDEHTVHAMVSVWDGETGRAIPSSSASVEIRKDGELIDSRALWSMLSQNMGFHYGDNVPLDGDGTYDVTVSFGPVTSRRTGAFEGEFGERAATTFELEFAESDLDDLEYTLLEDRQGEQDAVDPMAMETMQIPQLAAADALPGTLVGTGTSGDGAFPTVLLDERPTGVAGSGPYLAISARTPYNRYPLPFTSLSATITRDGETVYDGEPSPTIDPDLGYHYGASVESVESGDQIEIAPSAPGVARHEGYETAFLEMEPLSFTVESV